MKKTIGEFITECIAKALPKLRPGQVELFVSLFMDDERPVDLQERTGRTADALWKAKSRIRDRMRTLVVELGLDEETVQAIMNEFDRLRKR